VFGGKESTAAYFSNTVSTSKKERKTTKASFKKRKTEEKKVRSIACIGDWKALEPIRMNRESVALFRKVTGRIEEAQRKRAGQQLQKKGEGRVGPRSSPKKGVVVVKGKDVKLGRT